MSLLDSERVRDLLSRAGLADVPPRTLGAGLCIGAVIVAFGLWRFWPTAPAPEVVFEEVEASESPAAQEGEDSAPEPVVIVHVAGAVTRPGVYGLAPGARVTDAIAAAGGGLGNSALDALNLARILADGEQVYVPTLDEVAAGADQAVSGTSPAGSAGSTSDGRIDINRASATELEGLPGVGPSTAQKIVDDREANGPFTKPEDLMRVPGIGEKKFESMRDFVSCG
ncbi:MAG: ComEA family DNA-binding protein [Coriobacteriia bacterium]|nr:ComEA family DNA-binding protein [Coriobacteriia bacterium]